MVRQCIVRPCHQHEQTVNIADGFISMIFVRVSLHAVWGGCAEAISTQPIIASILSSTTASTCPRTINPHRSPRQFQPIPVWGHEVKEGMACHEGTEPRPAINE
jgi:hypothetical protein